MITVKIKDEKVYLTTYFHVSLNYIYQLHQNSNRVHLNLVK